MSRRTKKREHYRFHGWRRCLDQSLRCLDPAMRRRGARWRGMLQAMRRGPREPYEFNPGARWLSISGLGVHRLGSFSVEP
jgi:hypothetical protein